MKTFKQKMLSLAAAVALTATAVVATPATTREQIVENQQLNKKIRKELVTLPFYGVFDNLAYDVEGSTVTLYGQVVRPTTKSGAESRVRRLPGVERVVNKIEVLPLSPFDDGIRARTYRAVFGTGSLGRYSMGANPAVHIIVKRGHVTLEGVVANQMDKQLAFMAANGVPGVFSVTNNLRLDRPRS